MRLNSGGGPFPLDLGSNDSLWNSLSDYDLSRRRLPSWSPLFLLSSSLLTSHFYLKPCYVLLCSFLSLACSSFSSVSSCCSQLSSLIVFHSFFPLPLVTAGNSSNSIPSFTFLLASFLQCCSVNGIMCVCILLSIWKWMSFRTLKQPSATVDIICQQALHSCITALVIKRLKESLESQTFNFD